MSIDRHINLDLSMAGLRTDVAGTRAGSTGTQERGTADPEAEKRFQAALSDESTTTQPPDEASTTDLYSLFRAPPASAPSLAPEAMTRHAELSKSLISEVGRLMVGEGSGGGRQVRMELKDDVMPGVTLAIEERDGRLQVDLICSVESSRIRLNEALPSLASTLARRLGRDVLMRVQTDDEDDPRLLECLETV